MYDLPDYRLASPDLSPKEEEFGECMGVIEDCVSRLSQIFKHYPDYDEVKEIRELLEEALAACDDAPDYRERW